MDTYSTSPNECGYHWRWASKIVMLDDKGNCPDRDEHFTFGPAAG